MKDREREASGAVGGDPSEDPEAQSLHDQLKVFAREVGVLYTAERVRTRELEQALDHARDMYMATMKSLAHVVEAKDPTTRGHLDRTAHYGLALAGKVDPDLAARPEVAYGFFLHDIGKVGIPESILCKTGPLTDLEWIVMKSHPNQGARIVEPIPFMGEAVEIVRSHHERFDGGGYPRGLSGEEIPAHRADLRDRGFLRRDDERPTVSVGALHRRGRRGDHRRVRDAVRPIAVSRHSRSSPRKTTGSFSATDG